MRISRGRFYPAPFIFFILVAGCSEPRPPSPPVQQEAVWAPIRSWSGQGHQQLDSFTSDTGALKIQWTAAPLDGPADGAFLRVAIHSAISGRPLMVPIDHRGAGQGTAFVSEDPRVFFAVIESRGVAWSITIHDRIQ